MEYSESMLINRPAAAIWKLTGHPRGWEQWVEDIEDVRVEGGGQLQHGSVVTYRWRGRDVRAEVDRYEPGRVFGIHSSERAYEFRESIALRDRGDRTEVTFTMGFDPTAWWARILAVPLVLVKPLVLGRPLKSELRSLREAAERAPS